jgi:hypothetical protein
MATTTLPYRRVRGLGTSAFEYVRLYLGPDHLLMVSSSGYTENYKRFYYRDIQAMAVRKSNHGKVWNIVWGVLFWIFGLAVAFDAGGGAMFFWLGVAAIFLTLLVLNIGRGPTCVTQITTAVQTRTLAPLNRLRRARAVIAQIRPLIEAAQGPLPPEELARRLDLARRGIAPAASSPIAAAPPASSPTPVAPAAATAPTETAVPAPSETSLPPPG